jgi:hypothetical protein
MSDRFDKRNGRVVTRTRTLAQFFLMTRLTGGNKWDGNKMVDDKLAREEAQRAANYEAIKSSVKADVGDDIYAEAARPVPSQAARVEGSGRRDATNRRGRSCGDGTGSRDELALQRGSHRWSIIYSFSFTVC